MKLEICHITRYQYADSVTDSVNEIRLSPRTNYRQACYHHEIRIDPPAPLLSYEDAFGNRIYAFTVNSAHRELVVTVRSTVVTHDNDKHLKVVLSPEEDWLTITSEKIQDRFAEYLIESSFIRFEEELIELVGEFEASSQEQSSQDVVEPVTENTAVTEIKPYRAGVLEWVSQLTAWIYKSFEYVPNSTGVHTTVSEFYRMKRGVCQDFAHLMIAMCRIKGIPARYVSGYHFIGDLQSRTSSFEQASHAWVETYIPGTGWIGFDPTNNNQVDYRYVKLGHGRDYLDIVPMKGVYRGTPVQSMTVNVDVRNLSRTN